MKIRDIRSSFERTLSHLFACRIVPKFKSPIITECLLYRDSRGSSTEGSVGYCHYELQTKCVGKIGCCGNPDALKEHLAKQGLGWEGKKVYDYRCLRGHEYGSRTRTFPGSTDRQLAQESLD